MAEISIRNFSCLEHATITLKRLNVIIGPQGSGKSVTTKLIYFFADIPRDAIRHAEDGLTFSEYKKYLQKMFSIWFPPAAWGQDRFNINYYDQLFSIRVMRRVSGGNLADEVTINLSKEFEDCYNFSITTFRESISQKFSDGDLKDSSFSNDVLETAWRARNKCWDYFKSKLGKDIVSRQTFIPAGRAFFTSIGRLVAGIEHSGSLDPATLRFAKIFAGWRDRSNVFLPRSKDSAYEQVRDRVMGDLFGGAVQSKRDIEYIEMSDGRKVPFSSLSSGQQEMLPIWYFLDNMLQMDEYYSKHYRKSSLHPDREMIYIEEPEAHLFPSSQSLLLDTLVEIVLRANRDRILIITTHSPYIMARLNVLLKAGQMSRRRRRVKDLNNIVERSKWIQGSDLCAISINNGNIVSILDEDLGLIDAAFLDRISEVTSAQFDSLLDLEDEI